MNSGGISNFIWGCSSEGLGVRSPPVGSRVEALVLGPGDYVRSWSSLQTMFTDFDCRNDQHLKTSLIADHCGLLTMTFCWGSASPPKSMPIAWRGQCSTNHRCVRSTWMKDVLIAGRAGNMQGPSSVVLRKDQQHGSDDDESLITRRYTPSSQLPSAATTRPTRPTPSTSPQQTNSLSNDHLNNFYW